MSLYKRLLFYITFLYRNINLEITSIDVYFNFKNLNKKYSHVQVNLYEIEILFHELGSWESRTPSILTIFLCRFIYIYILNCIRRYYDICKTH